MNGELQAFDAARLTALTARFPKLRVAVLGDFFLDKYVETDPTLAEVSLETGRVAHQVVATRHTPGAAGAVTNNLAALGAGSLALIGFTGDDGEGWELRRDLAALGCDITHLHTAADRATPTYLKPVDRTRPGLDGERERYDTKNRLPVPPRMVEALLASLEKVAPEVDAVVVMDQVTEEGSGAVTPPVLAALAALAARLPKTVFWADSRGRIRRFRNVTVKVNQFELFELCGTPDQQAPDEAELDRAIAALSAHVGAPVFTTLGERGVRVSHPGATTVPAVAVAGPVDPTGAGDSFTSGAVLALAAGASRVEAALIGNLVASVTVRQLGTTGTASPAELVNALAAWRKQYA